MTQSSMATTSEAVYARYLSGKTIMVIGTDPWNSPLLSKHRLAMELCKYNKVVYVEPVFHIGKLLRRRVPRSDSNWNYHNEYPATLSIVQPYRLPKSAVVPPLRRISELSFLMQLHRRRIRPEIIISFNPNYAFLIKRDRIFVYYPVDSYGHSQVHPDIARHEDETLAQANMVVAGTDKLYQQLQGRVSRLKFLPHGVDVEAMTANAQKVPQDLQIIPRPLIGFIGAVNWRLNLALLEYVSQCHSDWSIVLVGPYDRNDFGGGVSDQDLARLKKLPNVYLLGPRPSDQVGAYLAAFNVSIMPYDVTNPYVHFASHKPLQCLAVGTPVVTTCVARSEVLPPNTKVAEEPADFVTAIEHILATHDINTAKAYRIAAQEYTWASRVEQLSTWIAEYKLERQCYV
jgi:glycosyltransferase involved in cell wall biosynthesis